MYRSSKCCHEYGVYRLKTRLRGGPQPNPADILNEVSGLITGYALHNNLRSLAQILTHRRLSSAMLHQVVTGESL